VVAGPRGRGEQPRRDPWRIQELARKRTAQALDPLDIPWRFQVRAGDPAAELEQAAAEQRADLIVVGSQGHTVVHRLLLGSVSTWLTHHAQRPVMVVPLT
jgi:nucleotide-binding universal stress UspA family protein